MTALPRQRAAEVVASVLEGRSLKAALAPAEAGLAEGRDRALLHAIVFASVRGALRWQAALALLLQRPLPRRARTVHAALITALAQIETLALPAHAVVDETVATVRGLGQTPFAGLANAVLRRWLRERTALAERLDRDPVARSQHPAWLLDCLRRDWPQHWPQIVAAGNQAAPLWLRVNTRRTSVDAYRARLAELDIGAEAHPQLPAALCLAEPVPIARLPGFADGDVSVQDASAQYAAHLLAAEPGDRVLDACAAPGGKTAHLLERTRGLDVVALDREPSRLDQVAQTLDRLALGTDEPPPLLRCADACNPGDWWDGRPFQRILLDAPCSATGILRRQPDVRLHRRAKDIDALAAQQSALLTALWPLLAPGGRLLYAVCSVLRAESEAVLMNFLSGHADATIATISIAGAQRLADIGVQILPGHVAAADATAADQPAAPESTQDGFAYALLVKR